MHRALTWGWPDTESCEVALQELLRQAPDKRIFDFGEIRSRETMEYAMTFAETGHLCMATLHANNANQALERILHGTEGTKRTFLSGSVDEPAWCGRSEELIRDKTAAVAWQVFEILLNSPRESVWLDSPQVLAWAKSKRWRNRKRLGMQTFDQALYDLVVAGKISEEDAFHSADSANDLRLMLKNQTWRWWLRDCALSGVKIDRARFSA